MPIGKYMKKMGKLNFLLNNSKHTNSHSQGEKLEEERLRQIYTLPFRMKIIKTRNDEVKKGKQTIFQKRKQWKRI